MSSPNRLLPDEGSTPAGSDVVTGNFGAGLPCDVLDVLYKHCFSCHVGASAIPPRMDGYDELVATSPRHPDMTVAEASLETMKGAFAMMPPAGMLAASEYAAFSDWVAGGMAPGECATAGGGLPEAPLVCTSDRYRKGGDDDEEDMYPGGACVKCHRSEGDDEAPLYTIAGTVYPTVREPDDCVGLGGARVVLTDADGKQWQLATRSGSGNFMMRNPAGGMRFPITAKVVANGKELAMQAPLDKADGDCNRCHTQDGADGAAGRIFAPGP